MDSNALPRPVLACTHPKSRAATIVVSCSLRYAMSSPSASPLALILYHHSTEGPICQLLRHFGGNRGDRMHRPYGELLPWGCHRGIEKP